MLQLHITILVVEGKRGMLLKWTILVTTWYWYGILWYSTVVPDQTGKSST